MVQIVIMPKLGQTVEESTVVKWHKNVGDKVGRGEILFEIETDKAVLEIESFFEGTLLKIIVPEGETVPVMAPVAFIGAPGEPLPEIKPVVRQKPAEAQAVPMPPFAAKPPVAAGGAARSQPEPVIAPITPARKTVSPRARKLIRECSINAEPIPGSGPGGRVTEKDVLAYLKSSGYNRLKITPAARALAVKESVDLLEMGQPAGVRITVEDVQRAVAEKPREMSKMRQIIAQRLTRSYTTTPHFFVTVAVDMTDLLALHMELKKDNQPYSLTDFILKAAAFAAKEFPAVNSVTDGRVVRWRSRVHLGLAVAVQEGLVVPVIRNADEISLAELHAQRQRLVAKARDGKLAPDEMTGGTFTVSNMGMLEVEAFSAIINPGESALLAVASVREEPVAIKNKVVIRSRMRMTLSADHRVVDGAVAARCINRIKNMLEDVELWKRMI